VGPLDGWLQRQQGLETLAQGVQERIGEWRGRSPTNKQVLDFLNGSWLGHSLHAMLTDLTLGAWTSAVLLDGAALLTDDARLAAGADVLLAIGLASVPATAAAGLADWQYTSDRDRRVGLLHALTNAGVGTLMGASLALRRGRGSRRQRGAARLLSAAGYLGLLGGAYLGGDLAYRLGVGVNRQAWTSPLEDFTPALDAAALVENQPTAGQAGDQAVVLVKQGDQLHALADACSHMGGPLHAGSLADDCITCPWHGSRFRLADGSVRAGPATAPQPCFDTRIHDGKVEIRSPA
jgi:nitrite reductase/ring-hydroxylating ferredoxin subunit/uncharacterized membrane protein